MWVLRGTPQMIRTLFSEINAIYVNEQQPPSPNMNTYVLWGKINALYKLSNVSDTNDLRAFIIMPVPFEIFREIHIICSIQSVYYQLWILDPFICMVGQLSFLPLGLNIIKFVLSIFRDNLMACNHSIILLNSLLTTSDNSCKFFELLNNVVSSAN